MIATDQPLCFPEDVVMAVSSRDDGTMLDRSQNRHAVSITANRRAFCAQNNIDYDSVVYQRIEYGDAHTYRHIEVIDEKSCTQQRSDVSADALITHQVNVGLFLPLADCIGLVLYDPKQRTLAIAHMGRHSTLTDLIQRVVTEMAAGGTNPEDIIAYMTPSAGKDSYRMDYFDTKNDTAWQPFVDERLDGIYLDLAGYDRQQLLRAGLRDDHIAISAVDTVTNEHYFSHSAGDTSGRFAVVAMMR